MAPRSSREKPVTDKDEVVVDTAPDAPEEATPEATAPPEAPADERPNAPTRIEQPREAPQGGRVIKFMGTSDEKVIMAGETANRTLPKLNRALRFSRKNNFIIDTSDYPEVPEEWWDYLVAFDDFEDFTGQPATDISKHQAVFQGMKKIAGQVPPAPGQLPTPQQTSGETIPDFFDSRAARRANASGEYADKGADEQTTT